MPKPDPEQIRKAQERLTAAKKKRDDIKAAADREFWLSVANAIDSGELRQTDACEALGYGREYVRRQLLELRATSPEPTD
ncbi:hypothetical protein ACFYWP_37200 [Actinacidiphila glaucinigra]|uniref:hypothetical protein n=1 Tax=Actinacidiphila glaucinigra TaxID=235986 RepID=UPI0036BC69AF